MRKFILQRIEDETGISGIGIVAHGVVFDATNDVVLLWLTTTPSIGLYKSINDVEKIHGHDGKTKIIFIDDEYPLEDL